MRNILINASAAKEGGAAVIIETFLKNLNSSLDYRFIVISPKKYKDQGNYLKSIKFSTNGISTILFSAIGIIFYMLKYKAHKVISFNNINCIFLPKKGITYFHQSKALKTEYRDIKITVYDFIIKNFLIKNYFIVQSDFIKELFNKKYSGTENRTIACWPGFIIPQRRTLSCKIQKKVSRFREYTKVGILPISYDAEHKNVQLIYKLEDFFKRNNILIITLLNKRNKKNTPFIHLGSLDREELFELYSKVDFMFFPSRDETVGLPIFEFLQSGKPAFIYKVQYSEKFWEQFNKPMNFILFKNEEDFISVFNEKSSVLKGGRDYSKGEWEKLLNLL